MLGSRHALVCRVDRLRRFEILDRLQKRVICNQSRPPLQRTGRIDFRACGFGVVTLPVRGAATLFSLSQMPLSGGNTFLPWRSVSVPVATLPRSRLSRCCSAPPRSCAIAKFGCCLPNAYPIIVWPKVIVVKLLISLARQRGFPTSDLCLRRTRSPPRSPVFIGFFVSHCAENRWKSRR